MSEGKRVVAGEAILSGVATIESKSERVGPRAVTTQLERLVREHSRLVYRIAYAVLRSHHDAEDSTQETFMRVLRYSSKLAGVEDPKTWLARIAWRVAVDRSRQRGRTREIPLDDPEKPIAEAASSDTPGGSDRAGHAGQRGAGENDRGASGETAPAADPVDDRRNVAQRCRRDLGHQRSGRALPSLPRAADSARRSWPNRQVGDRWNHDGSESRASARAGFAE